MKKWLEPITTAWVGVATHKLRSLLTILGIVIGVAAVISLMSIGRGVEAQIISNIEGMGSDLITISPGATTGFGGVRSAGGSAQTLTLEDAEAISEQVPYISEVAPSYSSNLQLVVGSENINSLVSGVTPEYMPTRNLELADGTFFSESDYQRGAKVAVLGSNVKETLFGSTNPVGQQMRMGSIIVRIIGVLESKSGMMGGPDNAILIPLTAMQQTVAQPRTAQGERVVSSIALTVVDEERAGDIVQDKLSAYIKREDLKKYLEDIEKDKEKKKLWESLSASKKLKVLRYVLAKKGVQHGKK